MPFLPLLLIFLAALLPAERKPFTDRTYPSKIFGEDRHYRIFLPPGYQSSGKAYPVIYYFHGHSDRYTLERYDGGTDTVPKIVAFVEKNPVIVVAVDGYVARDYTGFYGGKPWDAFEEGGDYDFGPYFLELVAHIDGSYRTLTSRRYRAVSGLSMGGFMSLYLSARFPDWIGSASAFNPSSALFTGERGRRMLWRLKDHPASHTHTMVRLVRASGDYMSQYHEELREEYARAENVDFEYRRDEYHRHWATSIGETFDFHLRAFANPTLDNVPETFSHATAYAEFDVWGWHAQVQGSGSGLTYLEDAGQGGVRVMTRRWSPDGPPVPGRTITIRTAPLYKPGAEYVLLDHSLATGSTAQQKIAAGPDGRLTFTVDGAGHQVSFAGPGTGAQPPIPLPAATRGLLRAPSQQDLSLPIRIYNPRNAPMTGVHVTLSSEYPTVQLLAAEATIPEIAPGAGADISPQMRVRFTAGDGYFAHTRLKLSLTYDEWHSVEQNLDVLVEPEDIPAPLEIAVLDGRTATFPVFRQKGNQGGGDALPRKVTEGKGNGNGVLEAGEEATVWVRLRQGLDPFDKNNWHRAIVYSGSPWVSEVSEMEEDKQLEWSGGKERSSVIRLSPDTPPGTTVPLLLDIESWSFTFTPDVRYGKERLFQAFQLHRRHLCRYELRAPGARP